MAKLRLVWKDIKAEIKDAPQETLLRIIADLYDISDDNRRFLHARFAASEEALTSGKKIIRNAVCPEPPRELQLSRARKVISDYRKASGHPRELLELMVYYVECGNEFTLLYGDISESFYYSVESMFEDVVTRLIKAQDQYLLDLFLPRLQKVVRHAQGIGWGYYDRIAELLETLEKNFENAA
jgi:hypothetical protein